MPLPRTGECELKQATEHSYGGPPFLLYRDGAGVQRTSVLEGEQVLTIGRGNEVDLCLRGIRASL